MAAAELVKEKKKVYIVDTTLRDGEQTAGVVFANQEKITIAKMLSDLGVDQIEAGIPVMGGDEKEALKAIVKANLKSSIMAWNRAVISDLESSIDCGVDAVAISISTSDIHIKHKLQSTRERVLEQMVKAVEFAKKHGLYISVNAEDASRSDEDFLVLFAKTAKEAGANRLRYCDTVGVLEPFTTYEKVKTLRDKVDIDIEMHTHNDFGMATANTLAGIKAGANYAGVTVNGLGERAGNAALEEVAMALKHVMGYNLVMDTKGFLELSQYVAKASNRKLHVSKPIVGSNMFAHESGIHADGAYKNPKTYEAFEPEEVGLVRQIIIGKHSGSASIIKKFSEFGIELDNEKANEILNKVRKLAVELKRPLFDKELIQLYQG
ncbi:homocitrate synthase [Thermanaerosceptrum fracticalcis]|uniref:Homocitrate synthase n=1 Tax=Thermanaerosceptrum fracticalcis TaxID=1712410 RepID=A0A7G6E7I3_THEFR|nr:homocitrate synthase [Thermanaerosceptrum fracticalcis]QNB48037.1 homocitrate synthase [Thermanaerosceptrum fracticalcis]